MRRLADGMQQQNLRLRRGLRLAIVLGTAALVVTALAYVAEQA